MPGGFAEAVEAALAAPPGGVPVRTFDPATLIALGSLLVSAAGLGWTIYRDLKADGARPSKDAVARRVRLQLQSQGHPDTDRARIIVDVVVEELLAADAPANVRLENRADDR